MHTCDKVLTSLSGDVYHAKSGLVLLLAASEAEFQEFRRVGVLEDCTGVGRAWNDEASSFAHGVKEDMQAAQKVILLKFILTLQPPTRHYASGKDLQGIHNSLVLNLYA